MTMILPSKNRKKIFNKRATFVVVFVFTILIILGSVGFISIGVGTAKPILGAGSVLNKFGNGISVYFSSRASYKRKIKELEENISLLQSEKFLLSVIQSENKELKDLLGKQETITETILSKILVKENKNIYGTMILDQGENAGVVIGARVYADGVFALGEIVEVGKKSSLARLFSSSGVDTPARFSISNLEVMLHGRGGGSFSAYLPHNIVVLPEEIVSLTSKSTDVVAHFVSSNTDPRDPEQTIYLRTPVNINTLNFVQIEKKEVQ